jgi:O-antigen ligase
MILLIGSLAMLAILCFAAFAAVFPLPATILWILALETSPEIWLYELIGGHETIIAVTKGFGLVLALILGIRHGARADRFNPGFGFFAMFCTGLIHGLHPGLSILSSLRSLIGSAAPFSFSFVRLPRDWCATVIRTVIFAPLFAVAFGGLLAVLGVHGMYAMEQGALRLGASGEPPFLAGYALIALYAGLFEVLDRPGWLDFCFLAINFVILLLTGARSPLALASALGLATVLLPVTGLGAGKRINLLAGAGALISLAVLFIGSLSFIRVVNLAQAGEAGDLSNRGLVWPIFEKAIAGAPWFGWGVGAGKVIVPVHSPLGLMLGTNAAHNEYLRIAAEGGVVGLLLLIGLLALWVWRGSAALAPPQRVLMRLIFAAFAAHSATDNTLIATTSSIFFIWVSAVFATAGDAPKAAA